MKLQLFFLFEIFKNQDNPSFFTNKSILFACRVFSEHREELKTKIVDLLLQ